LGDDWAQRPDTCCRWIEVGRYVLRRRNFSRTGASGETILELLSFKILQQHAGNISAEVTSLANANHWISAGDWAIARVE